MDIVSAFNPPRMCYFGGTIYWVKPLVMEDFALLVAWLDDVLPGKADRAMPPPLGSEEAQQALLSPTGQSILAWLGLRQCGVDYAHACAIWKDADLTEQIRLLDVLYSRRRTIRKSDDGEDLAVGWWGGIVAQIAEHYSVPPGDFAKLSLDQVELLCADGAMDEKPGTLTLDEVQAMWESSGIKESINGK